jgi:hypothetical protein
METICDPPDWGICCIVAIESHHTTRNDFASTKKQFFVSGKQACLTRTMPSIAISAGWNDVHVWLLKNLSDILRIIPAFLSERPSWMWDQMNNKTSQSRIQGKDDKKMHVIGWFWIGNWGSISGLKTAASPARTTWTISFGAISHWYRQRSTAQGMFSDDDPQSKNLWRVRWYL